MSPEAGGSEEETALWARRKGCEIFGFCGPSWEGGWP
jgi:hypothetical protein